MNLQRSSSWTPLVEFCVLGLVSLFLLLGRGVAAENWSQVFPQTSPSARNGAGMAYDSGRNKVVLFGGANGSTYYNDTWEYDGVVWTRIYTPASPSQRYTPSMDYDSNRGKMVLFGGGSGVPMNDTWEYDGSSWQRISTANAPSARSQTGMAYDSVRRKMVLFGGNSGNRESDTWEFDGTDWRQIITAYTPQGRYAHAIAYDRNRQRTVILGGRTLGGGLGDLCEYDGINWKRVTLSPAPSARRVFRMTYDSNRKALVMFGGFGEDATPFLNDMWTYDGSQWEQIITGVSPSPRVEAGIIFDSSRRKLLLFGGVVGSQSSPTAVNETWELGGSTVSGGLHPADANGDWRLDINEVTAYGSAWKRGSDWSTGPNPIDINYVTRAGFLWKNGEAYRNDGSIPPACWVNQ